MENTQTVRYWTTRNDANYDNRHAEVNGVTFFAFPYQSYYARVGDICATVGGPTMGKYHANIFSCLTDGQNTPKVHGDFTNEDDAFVWAAEQLKK